MFSLSLVQERTGGGDSDFKYSSVIQSWTETHNIARFNWWRKRSQFQCLDKSRLIGEHFTVLHSIFSRCPLLHPGWSPPGRQSGWVWLRRTKVNRVRQEETRIKLISGSLPWQNRIGCISQSPCCVLDCRTRWQGSLPDPAPKDRKTRNNDN